MAKSHGARTVYIGLEEPANRAFFDDVVLGKAGEVLPALVNGMVVR